MSEAAKSSLQKITNGANFYEDQTDDSKATPKSMNFCYFEVYRIDVENGGGGLDRVKMHEHILFTKEQDSILDNQQLVFRGPSLPRSGLDPVPFFFGPVDSWWYYEFNRHNHPSDTPLSIQVKNPDSDECFVIHFEQVSKAIQAHLQVIYQGVDEYSDISIAHARIFAVSGDDHRTKRLLLHHEKTEPQEKKLKVLPLESGQEIDLLRSVIVSHLDSNLVVEVDVTLSAEARGGGPKTFFPVTGKVTFKSPSIPYYVLDRNNIERPEDIPREDHTVIGAGGAKITVAVAWFNDETPTHNQCCPSPSPDSDEDIDSYLDKILSRG